MTHVDGWGKKKQRENDSPVECCIARETVAAGFPSPAMDYAQDRLNLDDYLMGNGENRVVLQAAGFDLEGLGIYDGDLLVVDTSRRPGRGMIGVVIVDGDMLVRRFTIPKGGEICLSDSPEDPGIPMEHFGEVRVLGVVTARIHKL